jgi:RluA family pseudouridine synthase
MARLSDPLPEIRLLIDVLSALRPTSSRTTLRQLLAAGRVRLNGEVIKLARMPIAPDDKVEITDKPEAEAPPVAPFPIVHEDADLLIIDKHAGLLTSTVPNEKRRTALALALRYAERPGSAAKVGLIHRLDRDASGLLVFSLSQRAYVSLKEQFQDRTAGRIYAAVAGGKLNPTEGTIKSRLVEYADGTVHSTRHRDKGEDAITHYTTLRSTGTISLLRVTLETGRKHQIRAHLAERGHPIVVDRLSGGAEASRLMLAAIELRLRHPADGREMRFAIDIPQPLTSQVRG